MNLLWIMITLWKYSVLTDYPNLCQQRQLLNINVAIEKLLAAVCRYFLTLQGFSEGLLASLSLTFSFQPFNVFSDLCFRLSCWQTQLIGIKFSFLIQTSLKTDLEIFQFQHSWHIQCPHGMIGCPPCFIVLFLLGFIWSPIHKLIHCIPLVSSLNGTWFQTEVYLLIIC